MQCNSQGDPSYADAVVIPPVELCCPPTKKAFLQRSPMSQDKTKELEVVCVWFFFLAGICAVGSARRCCCPNGVSLTHQPGAAGCPQPSSDGSCLLCAALLCSSCVGWDGAGFGQTLIQKQWMTHSPPRAAVSAAELNSFISCC